jgi:hypothetical protein
MTLKNRCAEPPASRVWLPGKLENHYYSRADDPILSRDYIRMQTKVALAAPTVVVPQRQFAAQLAV